MEEKDQRMYTLGHWRMKLLDEIDANYNAYRQGDVQAISKCNNLIEEFLLTIKENSETANFIKKEFDSIYTRKNEQLRELDEKSKNLGYLERKDAENLREAIEYNNVHDKKIICRIALLKYKLHESEETDYKL